MDMFSNLLVSLRLDNRSLGGNKRSNCQLTNLQVFFADSKRLLGLADCSARDFTAQLAHVSLVMIRYNLLPLLKRSLDYETIGGLFKDVYTGAYKLTVVEKIWLIIVEVVGIVAGLTGADEDTLMRQLIENNKRLEALQAYAQTA